MVYSLSRETFDKRKPTAVFCLYLKNFDLDNFDGKLKKKISIDSFFAAFLEIFQSTLSRFATYKQKRTVQTKNTFMTKQLRNEIMLRS